MNQKQISDMKLFTLRNKGYKGDPSVGGMIEYLQNKRMFVALEKLRLYDPDLCEKLYQLVKDSLK